MASIKERVYEFCSERGIKIRDFERACDLSNGYISSMRTGFGREKLNNVLSAYPDLSREWLLYGEGEMLRSSEADKHEGASKELRSNDEPTSSGRPVLKEVKKGGLPLIPIDAVAGFNGWDESGVSILDCARYDVPDFETAHADFLIRVSGSSMYPKYSSGDILACRKIDEITFLQWGKIYVIDSRQGAMVKRLFPMEDNAEMVLCKSDNPNYPPFELPKEEIRSLSIVVGAIRLE